MRATKARTITPDEDIAPYPYRRVWRSLIIEAVLLGALMVASYALFNIVGVQLPALAENGIRVALVLAPLGFWLVFSVLAERRALQPRGQLVTVAVVAGLAANAITLPLIEQGLQPQAWLAHSSAITRIVGYTLSVGVATEFTKYMVIRYTVWPGRFQTRIDGIAYAVAASIGVATVWNVSQLIGAQESVIAIAVRVFDTTVTGLAAGMVIGYGLSETALSQPTPFIGPLSLALAALVHGAAIPLRTGLINASFSLSGGNTILILGAGISVAALVAVSVIISFLFAASERREREAAAGEP